MSKARTLSGPGVDGTAKGHRLVPQNDEKKKAESTQALWPATTALHCESRHAEGDRNYTDIEFDLIAFPMFQHVEV